MSNQPDTSGHGFVRAPPRALVAALVRTAVLTVVLWAVSLLTPRELRVNPATWGRLAVSVIVLAALLTVQILAVARSPCPILRAAEAVLIGVIAKLLVGTVRYRCASLERSAPDDPPIQDEKRTEPKDRGWPT